MKKFISLLAIITLLLPSNFSLKAEVDQATINYLQQGVQHVWATQALKAAGQNNLDLGYLQNFDEASATSLATAILAITAGGQNPADFNERNFTDELSALARDNQLGSVNFLNDDFWGILALSSAGLPVSNVLIQNSKTYILNNQNQNGGWGFSLNGEADTNDTAAAIMALLEAGQAVNSEPITRAMEYLRTSQNADGGFSFSPGGVSDVASGSWVIATLNKLAINPATWTKGENNELNPLTHLNSLKQEDGSFKWTAANDGAKSLTTAYAAVALAGSSYPVAKFVGGPGDGGNNGGNNDLGQQGNGHNGGGVIIGNKHPLRIEGSSQTICETEVAGATPMAVLQNGAAECGYELIITNAGLYVAGIGIKNNENGWQHLDRAGDENGWRYRVNWLVPDGAGAAEYRLQAGDYVLWYFASAASDASPLRLELNRPQVPVNQDFTATVYYFNDHEWLRANQTRVKAGGDNYITNENGEAVIRLANGGVYLVSAEKDNFVRSQRAVITIGNDASEQQPEVKLKVVIENHNNENGDEGNNGRAVAILVDTKNLDFGILKSGEQAQRQLRLVNRGQVDAIVEGVVSGDDLFATNLYLNGVLWAEFQTGLSKNGARDIGVDLRVPAGYNGVGLKEGKLIFWAQGR